MVFSYLITAGLRDLLNDDAAIETQLQMSCQSITLRTCSRMSVIRIEIVHLMR